MAPLFTFTAKCGLPDTLRRQLPKVPPALAAGIPVSDGSMAGRQHVRQAALWGCLQCCAPNGSGGGIVRFKQGLGVWAASAKTHLPQEFEGSPRPACPVPGTAEVEALSQNLLQHN